MLNKWVLGGFGFLILFAGLCYLYYQWTTAPYRKQAVELNEIIHQSEQQRTATSDKPTEQAGDAPAESITPTAEKPITDTPVTKDIAPTQAQNETPAQNAEPQEVRMSPFGFGPYPELPADFPHQHIFEGIN